MKHAPVALISLDERRRAPLSRFVDSPAETYAVDVDENGTITLTPGRFVADHELRLHEQRPDLVERINQDIDTGNRGNRVTRRATR
jgi:hypothetical protein